MNVAFIPVRGGSKSIPLKNIRKIARKPLVYWTVKAATECECIDKVYVATDSDEIKSVVESFSMDKVCVIGRSEESASDTASTESALLEFAEQYEFEHVVLIQATSPLLTCEDLEGGFREYRKPGTDSVLSVVIQKRFNWATNEAGFVVPTNYDVFHRPRRQEFKGYLVENGAFYITSKKLLVESKNRVSGNIRAYEMDESTYFEIDEPSDWEIIEKQLESRRKRDSFESSKIKMLLTDCDGCLTDGGMYYSENGDELKKFNTKDGMAFHLLKEKGIITGIITGEDVELNKRRALKLRIDELSSGCADKREEIIKISQKYKIDLNNICYIGDDINDLEAMKLVGLSCCPNDAVASVKEVVDYVTLTQGGKGVVREVVDLLIDLKMC